MNGEIVRVLTRFGALLVVFLAMTSVQADIRPEEAVQVVQRFCGRPDLPVEIDNYFDVGSFDYRGDYYELRVPTQAQDSWAGWRFYVKAANGMVWGGYAELYQTTYPPTLAKQEARAIAERFIQHFYPGLLQGRWQLQPEREWDQENGQYGFIWKKVLNAFGTVGPDYAIVFVNGNDGRILSFYNISSPITGPTIPQVSRQQAIRLAAQYAQFDPVRIPFAEITLELVSGPDIRFQALIWRLRQFPNSNNMNWRWEMHIDAITGEFLGYMMPLGGGMPQGGRKVATPKTRAVVLQDARGAWVGRAYREGECLWMLAAQISNLKAAVNIDKKQLSVKIGDRMVDGQALGAKQRDYGWWAPSVKPVGALSWWIPVRQAAKTLGWRVHWLPSKHLAVIDTRRN